SPQDYSRIIVIFSIYALSIRIYMDFSGYTDLAVGASRLFGYKIMENFNRPFFKKNIVLFWRNWHISVYSWIRDYFFFPVFGSQASVAKLYMGLFLSMVVFHLWHEASFGFLIMGVYHGAGLVIFQLFQELKKRLHFPQRKGYQRWLDPLSTILTFSFVSFGFLFFGNDIQYALDLIKRIFF
ncbi:MBOAT family O-acyltransferase, partial [Acidobacteriota bacterium]